MNITPEQAQEWLDGAIPGPWEASFDEVYCATRLYAWGEGDEIEDGDSWELARHAPDLAQTVIDQGKRIEELEAQNKALRNTDTSEWGY